MTSHPVLNASFTLSPSLKPSHLPQPTAFHFGGFNQNQWGPDSIGTILFGVVMFFIGITALRQGRVRRLRHEEGTWGSVLPSFHEEQGRCTHVRGRPVAVADELAMADLSEGFGSERVAVGTDEQAREDEAMEQGFVKIEMGIRTGTEGTLVGHDDDESEGKEMED
ncbi:hypothetical protein HO133_010299 [Letharia lupina]|uniref:Uncharacterized protein n=1 Tax=Letharia lupina TaxID=560253 RepID=A0A8H6CKA8_9LECA|nr:uncharacterized protein HO133_010299 [Letharia lupina]KAF6225103.1 hypothetical protein HO133_010299 [Letharia lupina]